MKRHNYTTRRIARCLPCVLLRQFLLTILLAGAMCCLWGRSVLATEGMTVGFLVGISGLGDQSFNDMAYAGLIRAKREFGFRILYEESTKSDSAFEASFERLLRNDARIIVANGFYMRDKVMKYAVNHPDTYFILQDAVVENMANVVSILYSVEEGSFLAGALAGMMTRTGQVGFIGGVDIPVMHPFRDGFSAGVRHVREDVEVREEFVTQAPDFSGFSSPERGYDMAMATYADGVDIIYAAAGLTGNGVLEAARKSGKFAIGVDSDQDHMAKGHILTSMMKRLDITIYKEVREIIEGRFTPGTKRYGLKEHGVGLSDMKYTRHLIPDETLTRLLEIEAQIVDGTIQAPGSSAAGGKEQR